MRYLLLMLVTLCVSNLELNGQQYEWAKEWGRKIPNGNSCPNHFYGYLTDAYGSELLTSGTFSGTVDFDPSQTANFNLTSMGACNKEDAFVAKYTTSGNLAWTKPFNSPSTKLKTISKMDATGAVYTFGEFTDSVDLDPSSSTDFVKSSGSSPSFYSDIFLQKMDANGNYLWGHSLGGVNDEEIKSLYIEKNTGGIYMLGKFSQVWAPNLLVDFDPDTSTYNIVTSYYNGGFICHWDSSGAFVWADTIPVNSGNGFIQVRNNHIYVFNGTDIIKYSSTGNRLWKLRPSNASSVNTFSIDYQENIIITGDFIGTIDFDPGTSSFNLTALQSTLPFATQYSDIYIQKLDSSGAFVWCKSHPWLGGAKGYSTVDSSGSIYTAGFHENGPVDLDPGPGIHMSPYGSYFVHKLSSTGVFQWGISIPDSPLPRNVKVLNDIIYIAGRMPNNTASTGTDFNHGAGVNPLFRYNGRDFLHAINQCETDSTIDYVSTCDSTFTWIDGNTYTSSNNNAFVILSNSAGCDSVVTLNLTMNSAPNSTISANGLILTCSINNANYQWLDCNNNYALLTNEINQTLQVVQNGSYAVEVNLNGCVDTSACIIVSTVDILEDSHAGIRFFPNPSASGSFKSNTTAWSHVILKLFNARGELVQEYLFDEGHDIEFETNQKGLLYYVLISNNQNIRGQLTVL